MIVNNEGIKVLEFFSGIGGMRLSLPLKINDIPITSITAYDCNTKVNQVYQLNFHSKEEEEEGVLKETEKKDKFDKNKRMHGKLNCKLIDKGILNSFYSLYIKCLLFYIKLIFLFFPFSLFYSTLGLKGIEIDGQSHVWTMSPPCQPTTTTRHANRFFIIIFLFLILSFSFLFFQ